METVIRVAVIYILIVAGLRVMGKREFSQLSSIELVALLLIPELVAQALIREDFSMVNAIIALTTLFSLVFITSFFEFHSKIFSKIVSGSPSVIVSNGTFHESVMSKERVSEEEVFSQMHKSGLERIEQVKWAILESDGRISIVPKSASVSVPQLRNEETPTT